MTKKNKKAQSFKKDFCPRDYLCFYLSGPEMNEDELITYKYMMNYLQTTGSHLSQMLEVGCGPT